MNALDKTTKATKVLIDSAKDLLESTLLERARAGDIDLTADQLTKILSLSKAAIDTGFNRALPSFQKTCAPLLK